MPWRVGRKVPVNVYDNDRPVCQCHNEEDAARIVLAVNAVDPELCREPVGDGWCGRRLGHEGRHMFGTGD
jgi:hypothetical protein